MTQRPIIYIPFSADLYDDIVRRMPPSGNAHLMIEGIVESYLDKTYGDPEIWSERHAEEAEREAGVGECGDPRRGFQWQTLFLPNGTRVRMTYKGGNVYAAIQNESLVYEGQSLSPSEFASKVAGGTNRNAWRDLFVQLPGTHNWVGADIARKQVARRT